MSKLNGFRQSCSSLRNLVRVATVGLAVAFVSFSSGIQAAQFVEVVKQDRIVTVNASGVIASVNETSLGVPPSDSWRLSLAFIVEEGSRVREGQTVFSIESSREERNLEELRRNLQGLLGEVESQKEQTLQTLESEKLDRANLESQKIKAERKAELPPGVVPGVEYAILLEQKRLAQILYERGMKRQEMSDRARELQQASLQRRIARVETRIADREREMAAFTVRAPISGLVLIGVDWEGNKLDNGDRVSPGRPVVTIVDDSSILVKGDVHEQFAGKLAVGQRVVVTSDTLGGAKLNGTIDSVGNTVRRKSQRSPTMVRDFTVKFDEDYSAVLNLGVSVQVTIEVDTLQDAISVPKEALVYREGLPGVVVGGKWTKVQLGSISGGHYIVLSGVSEGDRVRL